MIEISSPIKDSDIKLIQIKEFETIDMSHVLNIFQEYKKRGVILNGNFQDSKWRLDNFTSSYTITFDFNNLLFIRESKKRDIGEYEKLVTAVKAFIVYKLETSVIQTIYDYSKALTSVFLETNFFMVDNIRIFDPQKSKIKSFGFILDFLNFYNKLNVDDEYIEIMMFHWENYTFQKKINNQRNIGRFESIFKLSEVIEDFWESANQEFHEKYYPIKIWWEISMIIPIRTTELALTPYDCIKEKENNYYLQVRRTQLKGNAGKKKVSHSIENDYRLQEIRINKRLYQLIDRYRQIVDDYDQMYYYDENEIIPTKRKFLFSYRSYFKYLENKLTKYRIGNMVKQTGKEYFSAGSLHRLLDNFFIEIVSGKYNYEVISKLENKEELEPNQIELVNPMDTRHFAFINMVLNDIEPLFLKKLGGHDAIDSSIHYFSHIDNFIKCFTYSTAKRLVNNKKVNSKKSELDFYNKYKNTSKIPIQTYRNVKNGRCISQQSLTELMDCRRVNNNCLICSFFQPKNTQVYIEKIKENEDRIETEITNLKHLIEAFKRAKNFNEEFMQKINIIKGYANQNAGLISNCLVEENTDG
ncbi:hypothetical protein VO178_02460 [Lysinibacillus fusiformis]|uniref:hypothetical protein n=1 Tax=Lysinibacillus fusiformis TaxID=28031 RepID=UPI002D78A367|nr:hypothetical protein [Lysinibacillus fusiformis]WRS98597.1 hypothetical protein VO178_02460 [Lysinibacillus fusiformis]